MELVKKTIYLSLLAQFVALLIGFYVLTLSIPPHGRILKEVMWIENIVQFVEFIFYIWFGFFVSGNVDRFDMAKYRYYDWIFTTPIMLLSTMLYFDYTLEETQTQNGSHRGDREKYEDTSIKYKYDYNNWIFPVFLRDNKWEVIKMVLSNMGMLLFGYLHEIGLLSLFWSTLIGFGFFFYTFYILRSYAKTSEAMTLFNFMFVVWAIYGIAPFFNYQIKNVMYNILDIFAKNFYGVFIAYKIFVLHHLK
jgi:bacteriorhodopsin